jgi:phage terminase large subunit
MKLPIPEKLLFLKNAKSRYKIIKGGRGGAKSETIARVLLELGQKKPMNILCTREYQVSISKSVHRLFERLVMMYGLTSFYKVYETKIIGSNGTEFGFSGLQNIHNLKSIDQVDICWITEASTLSKHNAEILGPSIRKEGSEIWMDFNPEDEDDYIINEFCKGKPDEYISSDTILRTINWDENPFFPAVLEVERQKCLKNNPEDYDHIWGGQVRTISDAQIMKDKYTIKEFDESPVEEIEYNRFFFGADFGAVHPSTLAKVFIKQEGLERNLYISHEAYGSHVEMNELSTLYASVPAARDWPIKGDCAMPTTISYLAQDYDPERDEKGFNITGCEKWPNSIENGITYLKAFDNIFIHPRCVETAKEFRLYRRKVDKLSGKVLPVIVDAYNDVIDAIRYSIDDLIKDSISKDLKYDEADNIDTIINKLDW